MVGSASSNVFENEIRILLGMGTSTHLNVVQLLAYNAETETLVFEYCQHGNLKKFITENRSQFIDELDEVYASCNNSNRVSSYQEVIIVTKGVLALCSLNHMDSFLLWALMIVFPESQQSSIV